MSHTFEATNYLIDEALEGKGAKMALEEGPTP
jgi:hypothetical protein